MEKDFDSGSSDDSFKESIATINSPKNQEPFDDGSYNPLIPEAKEEKPLSIAELKMRYMRNYILSNKAKYCQDRKLSTICVTWNVNGREPRENLGPMLPESGSEPDIFALGLQEIDRRAEAYMYNISAREQLWMEAVESAIKTQYTEVKYRKIASKGLVGLFIIVMVREEHYPFIHKVSTSSASCGIMGIVGNKGAVGVRFKIYDDYLCFVNCHLAAHPNQVLRRNQDLSDLHSRMLFPLTRNRSKRHGNEAFTDDYWAMKGFAKVHDCTALFWMGDFNYRVEMDGQLARIFLQHGQIDSVLQNDQMNTQKQIGQNYLIKYSEANIEFAPSYSFDVGTDNYDSSEKQRVPSWCDRILWRTSDRSKDIRYDCLFEFKGSDHKPVLLGSELVIREIIKEKYETCYFESLKLMDAFENAAIPDTEVSCHLVDAGVIAYHHVGRESFKIHNKGRVIAQYRFIFHDEAHLKLPSWIRIDPIQGLIAPGQEEQINLSFVYDNSVARSCEPELEHILVLHIEGGRDHFISVSLKCRETSFGKKLDDLKFHRVLLNRNEPGLLFKVPTALWRLVDYFIDQPASHKIDNLFLLSGTETMNNSIQTSLDLHEPFKDEINCEVGYHSVAESILRFFGALPDSLIPSSLYGKCLLESKNVESTSQVLNEIPETNYLVFEYFMRFLRDIILVQNPTISRTALAHVIGMVLIRPPSNHKMTKKDVKERTQFFLNLLNK